MYAKYKFTLTPTHQHTRTHNIEPKIMSNSRTNPTVKLNFIHIKAHTHTHNVSISSESLAVAHLIGI